MDLSQKYLNIRVAHDSSTLRRNVLNSFGVKTVMKDTILETQLPT